MNSYILGIKPPDEKWKRMKLIWDSCKEAEIEPPDEVYEFFDGEPPDEKGVVVDNLGEAVEGFNDPESAADGFVVDLNKLPKDVKLLRFVNSY